MEKFGKVQLNTSGLRDSAIEAEGEQAYHRSSAMAWNEWLDSRHRSVPNMDVALGQGVSGEKGIESGWKRLCQSSVGAQEGLVFRL